MSELERLARRGIDSALQRHGIDDDTLLSELLDVVWAVRSWQPSGPSAPTDPRIALIQRITGRIVPEAIRESLIRDMGEATEKQLRDARIDWIKKNPRNQDAYTWVSWAKHSGKDNRRHAQPDQQEPAGFQGLKEWAERHATD